jgi:IPT/TIG domain-containing protein
MRFPTASRVARVTFLTIVSVSLLASLSCGGGGGGGGQPPTPPTLTSVTPSTGTVGTTVTIAGTLFAQSGSTNPTVTFTPASGGAGVTALVKSFSATSLDVTVPAVSPTAGAAYNVTVTNPDGGSATDKGAFTMALPTLTDINGGLSGSGSVNTLFIVDGNSFGDLTIAPAGGYSVDFVDPATSTVTSATGSVAFGSGDWANIFIVATVPSTLTASKTYQLTVTTPTGPSAPLNFLVTGGVTFSPSNISWAETSTLPTAMQGFPAVVVPDTSGANTFVYVLGGNTSSGATHDDTANVAAVALNQFVSNGLSAGSLASASWTTTSPSLPQGRGWAAAVSANKFNSLAAGNGNIYVLGGLDPTGTATSTVYYASVNADPATGTGSWASTTPLPQPLFAHGAAIFHGRIYVAGGNDSAGDPVAKVYSAQIKSDGTLAAWRLEPDLPGPLAYHQLVTSAGYMYVLGGRDTKVDPLGSSFSVTSTRSTDLYEQINIRTGALMGPTPLVTTADWLGTGSLIKATEKHTAVAAGGYILVSGGLYNGDTTGSSEETYLAINTDGTLSSAVGATGAHTISSPLGGNSGYDFFNHSAVYFVDDAGNAHVLILGGADVATSTAEKRVWYLK